MIRVPLTQGFIALIDDADADLVLGAGKWSADVQVRITYARRSFIRPDGKRAWQRLHTLLTGWPLVDHVDGDGLNNRRANLRPASKGQNGANSRVNMRNTSGYRGVSFVPDRGLYQVGIVVDRRRLALGRYADPADAARAYDAAARQHFGEFARLNFPDVTA